MKLVDTIFITETGSKGIDKPSSGSNAGTTVLPPPPVKR